MGYWAIIIILAGTIIGLVIYLTERPKGLQKEIERLRKSIVSEGLSFEQVEYKLENLKKEIADRRRNLESEGMVKKDLDAYLKELEDKIDEITDELFSKKPAK